MANYTFNKEQHTAKIKAGLETAKKKGKKLGRPKGGKIKGEDEVIKLHRCSNYLLDKYKVDLVRITNSQIAKKVGVSITTVQKIINKHKKENG